MRFNGWYHYSEEDLHFRWGKPRSFLGGPPSMRSAIFVHLIYKEPIVRETGKLYVSIDAHDYFFSAEYASRGATCRQRRHCCTASSVSLYVVHVI